MSVQIRQQATAAGTALTNSTTETSLARKAFAANELVPGKVYLISGAVRATATNSTDTLLCRLRFGTSSTPSSNTAAAAANAVDVADSDVAIVHAVLSVQTSTRAVIHGYLSDADAAGSKLLCQFATILTIAADTAYNLDLTGTWSVASASNSCQAEAFSVTEIA